VTVINAAASGIALIIHAWRFADVRREANHQTRLREAAPERPESSEGYPSDRPTT
jgi:hypothetical protein